MFDFFRGNSNSRRANNIQPMFQNGQAQDRARQMPQQARPMQQMPQQARPMQQMPQQARPMQQMPQQARPMPQQARPMPQQAQQMPQQARQMPQQQMSPQFAQQRAQQMQMNPMMNRQMQRQHQAQPQMQQPGSMQRQQMPQSSQMQMPPMSQMPPMPQASPRPSPQQGNNGKPLPKMTAGGMENPFSTPLPDGVRLVPMDENTMRNIASIGLEAKEGEVTPAPMIPMVPQAEDAVAEPVINGAQQPLAPFIQNERNGAIFYGRLTEKAPRDEYRGYLESIAQNCKARREKLDALYTNRHGAAMVPAETGIESPPAFNTGLRSAIIHETTAIRELCGLYESTADTALAKQISSQIYSKTSDVAMLNMMLANASS
ncbi:MAG: hypothetical protein FWD98_06305 [Defluviitaleaceae bacterium]|nr:hypothetical protein [Defluviitaleaceae bacterium]